MYALVRYDEDGIYYVSNSKNITKYKGITKAKYSNGHKYVASIIAKNSKLKYFCIVLYYRLFLLL